MGLRSISGHPIPDELKTVYSTTVGMGQLFMISVFWHSQCPLYSSKDDLFLTLQTNKCEKPSRYRSFFLGKPSVFHILLYTPGVPGVSSITVYSVSERAEKAFGATPLFPPAPPLLVPPSPAADEETLYTP